MTWSGILERSDLGSGGWILRTRSGCFELVGEVPRGLEGREVSVRGRLVEASSFLMSGHPKVAVDELTSC